MGEAPDPQRADLQRRLVWRIAIAIGLIVAAVVALEALDRYTRPKPKPKPKPAAEAPEAARAPAPRPPDPVPEKAAAAEEPPPPVVVNDDPSGAARPAAAPARAEAVSDAAEAPAGRSPAAGERPAKPGPELVLTAPPGKAPEAKTGVRSPAPTAEKAPDPAPARAAETPAPKSAEPAPSKKPEPAPPKGYAVQLGVFGSMENAQELQARMKANGIPTYTETRVHVGPFKDRAEADKARERLRGMGLSPLVVPIN